MKNEGISNYDHFDMWRYTDDLPEYLRNERNKNYGLPWYEAV